MRIAFISDIHFGKYTCTSEFAVPGETPDDQSETTSFQDGLVKIIKDNEATFLIIGGDLTSTGSPQEFYYCEEKIMELANRSDIKSENIIYTLGNHDVNWSIANLFQEENTLKNLVNEKYRQIAAQAPLVIMSQLPIYQVNSQLPSCGTVEKEHFILFILNSSSYCSNKQRYPHGRLGDDQLEWFRNQLMLYESDKRTKIVLLHHHPFNYKYPVPEEDISLLEEGSDLVSLAGEYGVNLILHGHRHHPRAMTRIESGWKNNITFICAGSVSVNCQHRNKGSIPNTAHIIDLTDAPDFFVLKNYEYSPSKGWIDLTNSREEAPIDPIMYLGEIYDKDTIIDLILKLPKAEEYTTIINYDDLPKELKFCSYTELNTYITEVFSSDYIICGYLPDNISLTKRKEASK